MPRGSKDAYTDKQKRKAAHIEEGYEERGLSEDAAERRAWATVNKQDGGGQAGDRGDDAISRQDSRGGSRRQSASTRRAGATGRSSTARTSSGRGR